MKISNAFLLALSLCVPLMAHAGDCTKTTSEFTTHVNVQKVRTIWLDWYNRVRKREGLAPYVLNDYLNASAMNWSAYAVKRGFIDHKRYAGSPYYDYGAIEQWFGQRGLTFANVNRATFSENIGWGVYQCKAADCTRSLITALQSTFRFYLAERQKAEHPHYASLMNKQFKEIGVGIAYSNTQKKYFLTIHYATAITSEPPPLCAS